MTMVRVFYEPPPFNGVGTDLNRAPYGVHGGGTFRNLLERASKTRPIIAIGVPTILSLAICYIPLMNQKLPFSMDPEYQAAQRAYMRYHNMNPIFGISSKRARAMDPES